MQGAVGGRMAAAVYLLAGHILSLVAGLKLSRLSGSTGNKHVSSI